MLTFTEMQPATQITVFSRLYNEVPSTAHPLLGLRFEVKDVFDIEGLKRPVGSLRYLSPSSTSNAKPSAENKVAVRECQVIQLGLWQNIFGM
jgi:hypothetical protein